MEKAHKMHLMLNKTALRTIRMILA